MNLFLLLIEVTVEVTLEVTLLRVYTHTYTHTYICICICVCIYIIAYMYATCAYICVCKFILIFRRHTYMYTCIHMYMHVCLHMHMCLHTHMCLHMHMCMHMCVQTHPHPSEDKPTSEAPVANSGRMSLFLRGVTQFSPDQHDCAIQVQHHQNLNFSCVTTLFFTSRPFLRPLRVQIHHDLPKNHTLLGGNFVLTAPPRGV